ncbi:MAG: Ig-like domain-containing protein [Nitrospirae bacterium]|nr:Ig-like domain-containing protein [Nitrospirota bacterium]
MGRVFSITIRGVWSLWVLGILGILGPMTGWAEMVHAECPPVIRMISSSPASGSSGVSVDTPITITWDKETLQILSDRLRDLRPALESVNIAGGRYRMGTLLTTEWGIGGKAAWEDDREVITPEAPLEPGTQYRVWTYLYMTIRNDKMEYCPRMGGEIIFKTAGEPPEDGNPVRGLDLSALYHGDEFGKAILQGSLTDLNLPLRVLTIRDKAIGPVRLIVYEGTPLLRQGSMVTLDSLRSGDMMEVTLTGGRVSSVILLDVEH